MNTTLQIRIDSETKDRARKVFDEMGLDLSSGIKLFLAQVSNTGEIPFRITSADQLPEGTKQRLVREADEALKGGKTYDNAQEMHQVILGG